MAQIYVTGNAVVVESALKLEDIKLVEKYRPEMLILKDEDGEPVYKIATTEFGLGEVGKYGAEFAKENPNGNGKATITWLYSCGDDADIKSCIADTIGKEILLIGKIEAKIPVVLEDIKAERESIVAHIEIAGVSEEATVPAVEEF